MVSYFLSTDDYSVAQKKIEEIKKGVQGSFDEVSYDLEEDSVYEVINDLTTVSLFEEPKVLLLKSAELITEIEENPLKELLSAMADYSSMNVLIAITTVGYDFKDTKKAAVLNAIKKHASFIEINVKNVPLDQYARNLFKEDGFQVEEDVISLLVSYCESLTQVNSSVEILKCYKWDLKTVSKDDVIKMIPKPLEDKGYELTNAVLKGDKRRVFEIYEDFKTMNAAGNLIPMLLNKFQQLYNVYVLTRAQVSQDDIAALFGVSRNQAYYLIKDSKNKSIADIKANIEYLNKLDMDIKSGKMDYELGIQLYFLR